MAKQHRAMQHDSNDHVINSGTAIVDVVNTSISAAGFVAVTLTANIPFKSLYIKTRDGANWLLSNESDGTGYITLTSPLSIDLAGQGGETVFYAKGTSSTYLEIIMLD